MKIAEETVRHVAKLARLAVTENEVSLLAGQLSNILDYAEQLQSIEMDDITPTSHTLDLCNVLREDKPHESLPRDVALSNAPDTDLGHIRVPAVMEG